MKSQKVTAALLFAALLAIPAYAQTSYPGTTGLIPPSGTSGTSVFTASVAGAGTALTDITIPVDLNHTWVGDLDIWIESPAGTVVQLWARECGSANDMAVVFEDGGAAPGTTCGPATGSTAPSVGALSVFAGEDPNGDWTLTVTDNVGGDNGSMNAWSVDITADMGAPQTPASSTSLLLVTAALLMAAGAFFMPKMNS